MEAARRPAFGHDAPLALDLENFAADLHGSILLPGSPDHDVARRVHSAQYDRRPAMIVRAADAADVALTVRFARESDLSLSVRGGAHSLAGFDTNDHGIVLDLGARKGLHIGGIGWLVRKFGMTIDALLAVEVVTADGRQVTASPDSHPTSSGRFAVVAATSGW